MYVPCAFVRRVVCSMYLKDHEFAAEVVDGGVPVFHGRGPMQLRGRSMYRAAGKALLDYLQKEQKQLQRALGHGYAALAERVSRVWVGPIWVHLAWSHRAACGPQCAAAWPAAVAAVVPALLGCVVVLCARAPSQLDRVGPEPLVRCPDVVARSPHLGMWAALWAW